MASRVGQMKRRDAARSMDTVGRTTITVGAAARLRMASVMVRPKTAAVEEAPMGSLVLLGLVVPRMGTAAVDETGAAKAASLNSGHATGSALVVVCSTSIVPRVTVARNGDTVETP